jgi:hypothetical protein
LRRGHLLKHANFFINDGEATKTSAALSPKRRSLAFGIEMELEVELLAIGHLIVVVVSCRHWR